MLKFEPFSIESLQRVLPYIQQSEITCSDLSAGALFMWQEGTDLRFCEWNHTLLIQQNRGEQPAFSYPLGKDPDGMIDELLKYVESNHLPLRFFAADEKTLEKIRHDDRLKSPMWSYDPKWSDYIYSFEEAKNFQGKKYSGQRNHINQFKKRYGEPNIRQLKSGDFPSVSDLLSEYASEHTDATPLERLELENTKKLLSVYESLDLYAAGLFVDGKIVAFSIGEVIGDMLLIHVEKALRRYTGIYPTMYSGFVRLMDTLTQNPLRIVNREDDSGDPGIRTSKMQYHPIGQADKNLVHVNSPASKLQSYPTIPTGGIYLTPFRQTDKKAYLDLSTDVQNNRYWGYDYREDVGITGQIDENTFYDSTMFDTRVGDSINLAIRRSLDGEMIGEVILWNFTFDQTAELGCRILPQYQGHGYGKAAFQAAADFAQSILGVTVFARCFHENTPSLRMIASSGFEPWYSNETHQYFRYHRH